MNFTSIVLGMSKSEQFTFFNKVKHLIPLTQVEIAREADVSAGLVSGVYSGINQNVKVLKVISSNIKEGWQDVIAQTV